MEDKNDQSKSLKTSKRSVSEKKAQTAVDKFIVEYLHNSDFSRDTPAWNHFQAGIPVLIGAIADEMEG